MDDPDFESVTAVIMVPKSGVGPQILEKAKSMMESFLLRSGCHSRGEPFIASSDNRHDEWRAVGVRDKKLWAYMQGREKIIEQLHDHLSASLKGANDAITPPQE